MTTMTTPDLTETTAASSDVALVRYGSYDAAQAAVDHLADELGDGVEGVRIVASDVRIVEMVTGQRGWLNSLGRGAAGGAMLGLFLFTFIGLFSIFGSIGSLFAFLAWGAFLGASAGALLSAFEYGFQRGRRDFFSTSAMTAGAYEVVVPSRIEADARRLLQLPEAQPSR